MTSGNRNSKGLARKTDLRQEKLDYPNLLSQIKSRIRLAQTKAAFAANSELLLLYWDVGRILSDKQAKQGWGARVYQQLSLDIKNEISEIKGFSERNLKLMAQFYREYPKFGQFGQQPVAQIKDSLPPSNILIIQENLVQQLVARLPWGHNIVLIQKLKDQEKRRWYMEQTIAQGWSRSVLESMLNARADERQGKAITNFELKLPPPQSELAKQTLKDPYLFDFLTLAEPFHERELEVGLIEHIQKFLLELGQGFSFVGRQFHIDLGGEDFYIDLLFYHLKLRAFVVIELKKGRFKPEYVGKLNFYLSVVDQHLKHELDQPSIGLILCQNKNKIVAEYSLQTIQRPIGISEYQITRALPAELKSSLPTIEEIEKELTGEVIKTERKRQSLRKVTRRSKPKKQRSR